MTGGDGAEIWGGAGADFNRRAGRDYGEDRR